MSFNLVHYSQQDPQWKNDRLGFGDQIDTIGYVGCALTATAMLLSGHGYTETPKTLNEKLKKVDGFVSAAIRWGAVSSIYSKATVKAYIPCYNSDAPLTQIDAAIAAGQPAIVQVDSSPADKIQTHWVVIYKRVGDDYLMLDPWPYPSDTTNADYLMKRYAQGKSLKRAISYVILYDVYGSEPIPDPDPSPDQVYARVKDSITWGLNIRSSVDTSSTANVITTVSAGTKLLLLESDGLSKIGGVNQWVRIRVPDGKVGYAAAWLLEKVVDDTPVPPTPDPVPDPVPTPTDEAYASVKASVTLGLNIRTSTDTSSTANVIDTVSAGTKLLLLDADGVSRIGTNQWVNIRTPSGKEGYAAAWLLDKVTTSPTPDPTPTEVYARVKASVTLGLNIRTSTDTSSTANVIDTVKAGTKLKLVDSNDASKIGGNHWVRVYAPNGKEGLTAAWYLDKA